LKLAILFVALLFVAAGAFALAGIYLLAGMPWAFLSVGVMLFGVAIYLRAGLRPNG
jgi:hypothetical protein